MKRLCRVLLVFLTFLQLCGGPQGLLQCAAWAGMLAQYAQTDGVAEAVVKTFDGEHPCALYRAIAESKPHDLKTSQPKRAPGGEELKLCKDMTPFVSAELPAAQLVEMAGIEESEPAALCGRLAHAPPVPPPRA